MSVLLTSDPWIATDDFNPTLNVAAALVGGGLSLLLAIKYAYDILSIEIRNKEDYEMTLSTAKKIADGAEQFLHSEYKILSIFVAAVTIILCAAVSWQSGMCFIVGAFLSATAGYVGMKIAVISNVRTTLTCSYTDDAKDGDDDMTKAFRRLNNGLNVAFKSGKYLG